MSLIQKSLLAFAAAGASTASVAGETKFFYDSQSNWGQVPASAGTNECDRVAPSGVGQSPVNLDTGDYTCDASLSPYQFYAGDCTIGDYKFTINDHGLKADVSAASCEPPKMVIPGTNMVYKVLQFHLHTGCENTFNSTGCDAELHMVHIAETKLAVPRASSASALPDLAVMGLMMHGMDEHSEGMEPLIESWKAMDCSHGDCVAKDDLSALASQPFSPYNLIPAGTSVFNFPGGLTTPPCWEVVNWNLAEQPVKISYRQLLAISNLVNKYSGYRDENGVCAADETVASIAGTTGRDTQDLLGRTVVKNCKPFSVEADFPDNLVEQEGVMSTSTPETQVAEESAGSFIGVPVAVSALCATIAALIF